MTKRRIEKIHPEVRKTIEEMFASGICINCIRKWLISHYYDPNTPDGRRYKISYVTLWKEWKRYLREHPEAIERIRKIKDILIIK